MSTTFSTQHLETISAAAEILGHKWSTEIIHALSIEPMGFCQIQRSIGGVNPRTLSARLDQLETTGILTRESRKGCAGDRYVLEQKGHDLLPILKAMSSWGDKYA